MTATVDAANPAARYLVLEDEPLIAMDLAMAFEDAGHEAQTASSCAEAMAIIEEGGLSGAVLDVNLGFGETCQHAAEELARRSIPFVLHTGDLNRVGETLRKFDVRIIAKPVPAEDVVEVVLAL